MAREIERRESGDKSRTEVFTGEVAKTRGFHTQLDEGPETP